MFGLFGCCTCGEREAPGETVKVVEIVATGVRLMESEGEAKLPVASTWSSGSTNADGSTQPVSDVLSSFSTIPESLDDRNKEFVARVQGSSRGGLGMSFDVSERHFLRITKIHEVGPIAVYNQSAPPERQIRDGDFVMGINGEAKGDTAGLVSRIQTGGRVDLVIRPPFHLSVRMRKSDDHFWGLHLGVSAKSKCMFIKDMLHDGAADEYNRLAPANYKLMPGDIVLMLNGASGSPQAMQRALKGGDSSIELALVRPCTP